MVKRAFQALAVLAVVLMALGLVVACGKPQPSPPPTTEPPILGEAAPETPFIPSISISHAPKLYEPFTVTFTLGVKPDWPAQNNVDAWLVIPVEALWLGGDTLRWRGDLAPGQRVTLQATLAFVKAGNARISGGGWKETGLGITYTPGQAVQLHITEERGEFGSVRVPQDFDLPPTPTDPALQEVSSSADYPSWLRSPGIDDYGWQLPPVGDAGPAFLVIPSWEAWDAAKASRYFEDIPIGPMGRLAGLQSGLWRPQDIGFRFESRFLIAAFDQTRTTSGYGFRITKVYGRGRTLTVEIKALSPREGWPVQAIPNRPYSVVQVIKDYLPDGEPVEVVFLVNGQEVGRQSLVVRRGSVVPYDAPFVAPGAAVAAPPPAPIESPTPWPPRLGSQVGNAVVQMGVVTVASGQKALMPITVRGVNDPDGLGAYQINVAFNQTVVTVNRVTGGDAPFGEPMAYKVDNAAGTLSLFGAQGSSIPGPTGDVILAYVELTAVGPAGATSALNVIVESLLDTHGDNIHALGLDGVITVQP